jgi:surface protein
MASMFSSANYFNQDISGWNVSNVNTMGAMFIFAGSFNKNLSNWNVSKVSDFSTMFQSSGFNNGLATGVGGTLNWNTSGAKNLYGVFLDNTSFNQNISSWDVSGCTSFNQMFSGAIRFNNGASLLTTNTAPLTWNLNTAGALKSIDMTSMFNGARSFSQNISTWNIKNVSTMTTMFTLNTTSMTKNLFDAMLTEWGITDASVNVPKTPFAFNTIKYSLDGSAGLAALRAAPYSWTVLAYPVTYTPTSAFVGTSFTLNYSVASTSPVTSRVYNLVNTATSTVLSSYTAIAGDTSYNFTGVNISTSGNASLMITDTAINAIVDVVQVNVSSPIQLQYITTAPNTTIGVYLGGDGIGTATINWGDLSSNTIINPLPVTVTQYTRLYASAGTYVVAISSTTNIIQLGGGSLPATGISLLKKVISFGSSSLTSLSGAFRSATGLTNVGCMPSTLPSTVTSLSSMFSGSNINDPSINAWDVSGVTDMFGMFSTATSFNQNLNSWNVIRCTIFNRMFRFATAFNNGGSPGTSSNPLIWNLHTTPININTAFMFAENGSFNQDLSFNTIAVTTMGSMFASATSFNRNISYWNVSNCTIFNSMFSGATAFNNGAAALTTNTAPLTWTLNTAGALKTIDMTSMFSGANCFSQDISSWNIKNVSTMTGMFTLNTTSMTKDLFNAMLTEWGITDASVNVPKTPFTFSTIKYTSGGSAGLTALQSAPYSWTVTANLVTYSPTSTLPGSTFTLNYNVASTPPVTGRSYTVVNTASPSTVLSTYVAQAGDTSYNFTGVTIPTGNGYNSFMIADTSINAIVDVVQINGFYPCLKEGTKILTDKGYVPIEKLKKGDLIKTPINDYKAVYMIGKTEIYNHALPERNTHQLYKCTPENYPEVFEDLILTGCHSILVDDFANDTQREKTREVNGDLYVTRVNYGNIMGGKYRLPACADERAVVYEKEGPFTIYHIALENSNYYHNYGIYANGLLVETCSQRYLNELSHMDSVE